MEEHPITIPACTIKAVADDRCGEPQRVGGVYPELVGATGEGGQGDAGVCPLHGDFFPDGASHLAFFRIVNLSRAIIRIKPEGQVDRPAVFMQNSLYYRRVTFAHLAFGKGEGECAMGLGGHGKDHQSGGVHIQPVDRRLSNHSGEKVAKARCGTVLFGWTTTGDGQQASWFIDDDDRLVVVKNDQSV